MSRVIRILAFTDTHGDLEAAESILALARRESPDLIVSAGDITLMEKDYEGFFDKLSELGRRVYFVPGNHEPPPTPEVVAQRYPYLENVASRTLEVAGLWMMGLGAEGLEPGGCEKEDIFLGATDAWKERMRGKKPTLLLTHYPPKGTAVDGLKRDAKGLRVTELPLGDEGGSATVRGLVDYGMPDLVICGHYHQCFGKEARVEATWIVNPGSAGRMVELEC